MKTFVGIRSKLSPRSSVLTYKVNEATTNILTVISKPAYTVRFVVILRIARFFAEQDGGGGDKLCFSCVRIYAMSSPSLLDQLLRTSFIIL